MKKVWSIALLLCVAVMSGPLHADDDSPKARLDKAKAKYLKDMEAYREEVNSSFEKREEVARKDGNKKMVDAIKEEKKLFDDTGAVPKSALGFTRKAFAIRTEMENSYTNAIKEFTREKQDDEAALVEQDRKAFSNLLGAWVETDPNPGLIRVFKFGGDLTEFSADRKLQTTGEWIVDKAGMVTANLKNGWTLTGTLSAAGSMKIDVFPPGKKTRSATLTFRRIVK